MRAYKFLRLDGTGVFSRFPWPLPDDVPGAWVEAPVIACRSGVHACRVRHLPLWAGEALFEVELAGEVVEAPTKVVATRGRLVRRIRAWEDGVRDEFTRHCAERAHELALGEQPSLERWDPGVEPSTAAQPALLGFVAARIAEERRGVAAYRAERIAQAQWLAERLQLTT